MNKQGGSKSNSLIYGARAVMEAIEAGRTIDKILIRKELESDLRKDVGVLARDKGIPMQLVPLEKLDRMAPDSNHQGVIAITAVVTFLDLEQVLMALEEKPDSLFVMLDQVSDVRNFGAIARTTECMGADAIIVPSEGAARVNADAMKVSAGALNHLAVCRVRNIRDAVHLLQGYGVRVIGFTEKVEKTAFEAELTGPVCLVFGSEDRGISKSVLKSADELVSIPMKGKIASLNVSVAVGMALMETARQRTLQPS